MQPRRDRIGGPFLKPADDTPEERRLFGAVAGRDPGRYATRWRFRLDAAPDFRVVKLLQDAFKVCHRLTLAWLSQGALRRRGT